MQIIFTATLRKSREMHWGKKLRNFDGEFHHLYQKISLRVSYRKHGDKIVNPERTRSFHFNQAEIVIGEALFAVVANRALTKSSAGRANLILSRSEKRDGPRR